MRLAECAAVNCKMEISPAMLMCKAHWYMVPGPLRSTIWRTYRAGMGDDYWEAREQAIVAVAERDLRDLP